MHPIFNSLPNTADLLLFVLHTIALTSSDYTQTICYTGIRSVDHNDLAQITLS